MSTEKISDKTNIIDEEEIKVLIKSRDIRSEDFYILEQMTGFSKNLLIGNFHNLFQFNRENSVIELERSIVCREKDGRSSEEEVRLYKLLLDFTNKYDWTAARNLVVVFERRKK